MIFTTKHKLSPLKILAYAGVAVGTMVIVCLLALVLFSDPLVNRFVKPRITEAFGKAYPAYSIRIAGMNYSIIRNRFGFDSVALKAADGKFSTTVGSFSVSGISWMHLLWGGSLLPDDFANAVVDLQDIKLKFLQSQHVLRSERLHISVPDSEIVAGSTKYYSLEEDEQLFAKSQFRQTRFRLDIPQIEIAGLDILSLFQGNTYRAKSIHLHDLFADILVNMDKPYDKSSTKPLMPNEAFSSIKGIVHVGGVKIINGRLKYCERSAIKAIPGVITFDKINVSVSGIANHKSRLDTAVINAEGLFMNAGIMKLSMAIPLPSTDFSLRYSGSLSTMNVTELNSFIEPAEHRRIKSGILQSAAFDINVNSGNASGALRVEYKDLSIAVLNKKTGSEKGIMDRLASLIGKIFVVRGTNMPDEKGVMKIGKIQYARNPDDYFLQFVWFALRSGIGDVVGF